ncbi:UNVERIFIED_CONTAM: hypothetical protein Sangu_1559400 [Sesamum angustifolium]|uniref:Uncharacterized protein n=1 Tax=Sesamum angustifolium TaxID=2727405 RepID=A0AAW2MUA0_9LAMI
MERNVARPRLIQDHIHDWVAEFSPAVEIPLTLPLGNGNKHKWMKKSIFWKLKYWGTHLIRHNLDIKHIEKNVFDNIFNTIMDTKENCLNAWKDLKIICNWPNLELDKKRANVMPKAIYTLMKDQKKYDLIGDTS